MRSNLGAAKNQIMHMAENKAQNLEPFFPDKGCLEPSSVISGWRIHRYAKNNAIKSSSSSSKPQLHQRSKRVEAKLTPALFNCFTLKHSHILSCEHNRLKKQTPNGVHVNMLSKTLFPWVFKYTNILNMDGRNE